MEWAGHVWRSEGPIGFALKVESRKQKYQRGHLRQWWKDRISILRLGVNNGKLAKNRYGWR